MSCDEELCVRREEGRGREGERGDDVEAELAPCEVDLSESHH